MIVRISALSFFMAIALVVASAPLSAALVLTDKSQVPVDLAAPMPEAVRGKLATSSVKPDDDEKPFFEKLEKTERVTGSLLSPYNIAGKQGKYVSWFGIVRKIVQDPKTQKSTLKVQHLYSDGLSDTHCMSVSVNGSGDFLVQANGTKLPIMPLRLLRVYGKVIAYKGSLPVVEAEFIKEWEWGNFNFMVYGPKKGNPEWDKLLKAPEKKIYEAFPAPAYYRERLGEAPSRIYDLLTEKQRLDYACSLGTASSGESAMARDLAAPKYVGTMARPASHMLNQSMPVVFAFKQAEEYVEFKSGGSHAREIVSKHDVYGLDPNTQLKVLSYKLFDGSLVALYEVKVLSGKSKGQTCWVPGFAIEPEPASK